jgi:purine-binding chemotaxis protein CheW
VKVDFLLGVGKIGKRFVLLIDLDRVISADEKEFAREVAAAPPEQVPEAVAKPAGPAEPAAGA